MRIPKSWRPLLKGFERNGQLVVWCPYCATFHHHGAGPGHRAAHCISTDSPFRETGYYIAPFNKSELRKVRDGTN